MKFYDCYIVYIHVSNFIFFVTALMRSSDGDEINGIKKKEEIRIVVERRDKIIILFIGKQQQQLPPE